MDIKQKKWKREEKERVRMKNRITQREYREIDGIDSLAVRC